MSSNTLKELIKARNILKRKFESIKKGETENELFLEKTFKPITTPLKKFVEKSDILEHQNAKLLKGNILKNIHASTPYIKPKMEPTRTLGFENSSIYESLRDDDMEPIYESQENVENFGRQENEESYESQTLDKAIDTAIENSEKSLSENEGEDQNISNTQPAERIFHCLKDATRRDRIFGPTQAENDSWFLGKTPIYFENKSVIVENTKYP